MLAIVGGKGGCGKTTTAVGLARALAREGTRPLVVDADCDMPNLHTTADTDREPGVEAVAAGAKLDRAMHGSREFPGVDVLPAGRATGPVPARVLRRVRRRPGPVLVDCPAGAADGVTAPLRAADDALVVSTPRRESLVDAAKTVRMARALDARVLGAVLTRVPGSTPGGLGPLDEECRVVASVPAIEDGDVLASRVGRASFDRLADRLRDENI